MNCERCGKAIKGEPVRVRGELCKEDGAVAVICPDCLVALERITRRMGKEVRA